MLYIADNAHELAHVLAARRRAGIVDVRRHLAWIMLWMNAHGQGGGRATGRTAVEAADVRIC